MLIEHDWISRLNLRRPWNEVVGATKDLLFVINQIEVNGHYSGTIIKKSDSDNYILNHEIEYKLSNEVDCKCDIPVYFVHKDHVIIEGELITSKINITRKVEGSQTESVIYANRDWFNTLHGFIRMRIAEYEDEKCHPPQLIHALDFVDYMFGNDRYKNLSRASRYSAAANKYEASYEEIRSGSIARVNMRRHCKDKWNE